MEYASWLAGEPWSDQPRCTHPLLADVARMVNDHTSDPTRSRLVALVPSVIGLHDDDPRIDARIAIRCATAAIRVVAEHRQRALAVSLLTAQKTLHDLDGESLPADATHLLDQAQQALAAVPHAAKWAVRFTAGGETTVEAFRQRGAPAAVRVAVTGIAEATISDPDDLLYDLLTDVVHDFNEWLAAKSVDAGTRGPSPVDATV